MTKDEKKRTEAEKEKRLRKSRWFRYTDEEMEEMKTERTIEKFTNYKFWIIALLIAEFVFILLMDDYGVKLSRIWFRSYNTLIIILYAFLIRKDWKKKDLTENIFSILNLFIYLYVIFKN